MTGREFREVFAILRHAMTAAIFGREDPRDTDDMHLATAAAAFAAPGLSTTGGGA